MGGGYREGIILEVSGNGLQELACRNGHASDYAVGDLGGSLRELGKDVTGQYLRRRSNNSGPLPAEGRQVVAKGVPILLTYNIGEYSPSGCCAFGYHHTYVESDDYRSFFVWASYLDEPGFGLPDVGALATKWLSLCTIRWETTQFNRG